MVHALSVPFILLSAEKFFYYAYFIPIIYACYLNFISSRIHRYTRMGLVWLQNFSIMNIAGCWNVTIYYTHFHFSTVCGFSSWRSLILMVLEVFCGTPLQSEKDSTYAAFSVSMNTDLRKSLRNFHLLRLEKFCEFSPYNLHIFENTIESSTIKIWYLPLSLVSIFFAE